MSGCLGNSYFKILDLRPHTQKTQTKKTQSWRTRTSSNVTCSLPKQDRHTTSSGIHISVLTNNFHCYCTCSGHNSRLLNYKNQLREEGFFFFFFGKEGIDAQRDAVTQSFHWTCCHLKHTGVVETDCFYFVSVIEQQCPVTCIYPI